MKKTRITQFLLPAIIALSFPQSPVAMDVKLYAIGVFKPIALIGCGGKNVSHWPAMVDNWYYAMAGWGHNLTGRLVNSDQITIKRFCDPDWQAGCEDETRIDAANAAMIATHGNDGGDHWQGIMRVSWKPPTLDDPECRLDAGGSAENMNLGDTKLEFIHLSSCYSADDDNLAGIRKAMYDPNEPNSGHAHQWDGFHGIMFIGDGYDWSYSFFANFAHMIPMADAWVIGMYDENSCGDKGCGEQCPVAYAIGSTPSEAKYRITFERYNNVISPDPGHSAYAYRAVKGCLPQGEWPFNPAVNSGGL